MLANILSLIGIFVSVASCYYAYKAFSSSKEISFPAKKPRGKICVIKQFSEESKSFELFISRNIHRKVYLNIEFENENFETGEDGESRWFVMWKEIFEEIPEGGKASSFNSHGYQVTIIPDQNGYGEFYWFKGAYRLSGYFYIEGYLGPYQGMMSATLSAAKTI